MGDSFDIGERITAEVDRRERLVEEVTLPEPTRRAAVGLVMPNIPNVMTFGDDDVRLAHRLLSRGYEWARASRFTLGVPLPDGPRQLVTEMLDGREGNDDSEFAWTTLTSVLVKEHVPFIFSEGGEETTFQSVLDRELTEAGVRPDQPTASGMVDAFTLGSALCAAEKQIILAIDARDMNRAVEASQRRGWRPWRR